MRYREDHIDIMHEVIVPIAGEDDAEKTIRELKHFEIEHLTVVFVAEQTDSYPNTVPRSVFQETADSIEDAFDEAYSDYNFRVVQSSDTIESIVNVVEDVNATSVVFRPRQHSFISRILTSSTLELIDESHIPVIALPEPEDSV